MLEALITSKTRIRLLIKFFSNRTTTGYLRGLEREFGESTNAIRVELNRLSDAHLIVSKPKAGKVIYRANAAHPLFPELNNLTLKCLGLDGIGDIIADSGKVEQAFITGDYAKGKDSGIIDLVVVGRVDEQSIRAALRMAEKKIKRKIRTLFILPQEYTRYQDSFQQEGMLRLTPL